LFNKPPPPPYPLVDHVSFSWFRQLNHHPLSCSPLDLESSRSPPLAPRTLRVYRDRLVTRDSLAFPLAPNSGPDISAVPKLPGFVGRPPYAHPLRRSFTFIPSHWISVFPLQLFSLCFSSVVDSSSCLIADFTPTVCFLHLPCPSPWSIYSCHPPPPSGMIVLFPYSCYSVTSIRTLCIQLPAEIGFYLSHPRLPTSLPVVLNILPLDPLPIVFFRICVVVLP